MNAFRLAIVLIIFLGVALTTQKAEAVAVSRRTAARVILSSADVLAREWKIPFNDAADSDFQRWPHAPLLIMKRYHLRALDTWSFIPRNPFLST